MKSTSVDGLDVPYIRPCNYMKNISVSSVYFINFLICCHMPRIFSSFVTSSLSSSAFLFIANSFRNQRQVLLLLRFFNVLNKFTFFLKLVAFSLYIFYFLIQTDLGCIILKSLMIFIYLSIY